MNTYVEYSFEKGIPLYQRMFLNALIALAVIFGIYSLFIPVMLPIMIMWIALAYYYRRSLKLEYEYILLDDEMSIDKIIAKAKRKRCLKVDLNELIDLSIEDDDFYQRHQNLSFKTKKYASTHPEDKQYACLLKHGNQYQCLILQADEKLLEAIKLRHPLSVHL